MNVLLNKYGMNESKQFQQKEIQLFSTDTVSPRKFI